MPRRRTIFDVARSAQRTARIDWKDPDAVREYLRDAARARRERRLDAVCPTRTCPVCGEVKPNSRQLEVLKTFKLGTSSQAALARAAAVGSDVAVCKGCAMAHFPGARG
jgi:hypothetical protein